MKRIVTETEVDQRVAQQTAILAARGRTLPESLVRQLARNHLEMTAAPSPAVAVRPNSVAPAPRAPLPPASLVALKVAPPAPTAAEIAERTRVQRIRALTRKGVESEAAAAIRSGMSATEFESVAAARLILDAGRRARGG